MNQFVRLLGILTIIASSSTLFLKAQEFDARSSESTQSHAQKEVTFSKENEHRLAQLLENQSRCKSESEKLFERLEFQMKDSVYLKEELKKVILSHVRNLKEGQKLPLCIVDVQGDFILPGSACPVLEAELFLIPNMVALLDAIKELSEEAGGKIIQDRLFIVVSQDAHRIEREKDVDAEVFRTVYADQINTFFSIEKEELAPEDIPNHRWGFHCLVGTYGVGMPSPIATRLNALVEKGFELHRFGKLNYSAATTGIELRQEVGDLSNPDLLRNYNASLYKEPYTSYTQFFSQLASDQKIESLLMVGICANYCVEAAAKGLAASVCKLKIKVIDPCVYFLLDEASADEKAELPYDKERNRLEDSYKKLGIEVITIPKIRSNPSATSAQYGDSIDSTTAKNQKK